MTTDIIKINKKLIDILSPKKGYFGRVATWGLRRVDYKYIGYKLTKDFYSVLEDMTKEQRKTLLTIMNYFEIHARAMKNMLNVGEGEYLYSKIAWSHFMTIIMFGMLEVAVKRNNNHLHHKGKKIKQFLEENLSKKVKEDISKRYSLEEYSKYKKKIKKFSDVIDHLWDQVRSGFIHDAGIEFKGLENYRFEGGIGTEKDPITIKSDVSMQELLQITWQAILNSYGYKGCLN